MPAEADIASTPTDVLRAAIADSTARLVAHDPGVRLGDDPEDVHQVRVATRRLRSDLRTFRPVLDPEWDESLRAELKWLGGLLGAVRDADVLLDRLEERVHELPPNDQPAGERLLDGLRADRERARDELLAGMRSDRYLELLERLVAAARAVPSSDDTDDFELDVAELAREAVEEAARRGARARRRPARRRAARGAHPRQAGALRRRGGGAGGREGRQALRVGGRRAAGRAGRAPGRGRRRSSGCASTCPPATARPAFVAGRLATMEEAAADESREEWPAAWKRARRRKLRRWM